MDISSRSTLRVKLSLSSSYPMSDESSPRNSMSPLHISNADPTIYFGYGSNLWRHQMRQRCPTSKYLGIARLKNYKWIIYDRGYANIVELDEEDKTTKHDYTREVWGLVYSLQPRDETKLDGNEGVPFAYDKEWIECEFWPTSESDEDATASEQFPNNHVEPTGKPDTSQDAKKVDMLIYINRDSTEDGVTKREYIYRINEGIKDALKEGMPQEYVDQVIRKFIPDREDDELVEYAKKQALEFEDER